MDHLNHKMVLPWIHWFKVTIITLRFYACYTFCAYVHATCNLCFPDLLPKSNSTAHMGHCISEELRERK